MVIKCVQHHRRRRRHHHHWNDSRIVCNSLQCFYNGFRPFCCSSSFLPFFSFYLLSFLLLDLFISTIHFYECLNTLKTKVDKWKSALATEREKTPKEYSHRNKTRKEREEKNEDWKHLMQQWTKRHEYTHIPLAATSRLEQANACLLVVTVMPSLSCCTVYWALSIH